MHALSGFRLNVLFSFPCRLVQSEKGTGTAARHSRGSDLETRSLSVSSFSVSGLSPLCLSLHALVLDAVRFACKSVRLPDKHRIDSASDLRDQQKPGCVTVVLCRCVCVCGERGKKTRRCPGSLSNATMATLSICMARDRSFLLSLLFACLPGPALPAGSFHVALFVIGVSAVQDGKRRRAPRIGGWRGRTPWRKESYCFSVEASKKKTN